MNLIHHLLSSLVNSGMLQGALAIFFSVLAILIVITIHELGHFAAARCCGVKIQRFSIGFGKTLLKWTDKKGTLYTLCLLPLGGYVKMLGEGQDPIPVHQRSHAFVSKSLLARSFIVMAGPLINFVLAIFLFWVIFQTGVQHIRPVIGSVIPHSIASQAGLKKGDELKAIGGFEIHGWQSVVMALMYHLGETSDLKVKVQRGKTSEDLRFDLNQWQFDRDDPQLMQSLGMTPFQPAFPPVIDKVLDESPAALGGLKMGDRILEINGHRMVDWFAVVNYLQAHPDQPLALKIQRNHRIQNLHISISHQGIKSNGYLGVQVESPVWPNGMMEMINYTPITALPAAITQTRDLIAFNGIVLLKLASGKISLRTLSGPIAIFQTAGNASQLGWIAYLGFVAFVSLSLGFINLLPIPCLDGGHLLFYVFELVFRRPIPERYQIILMRFGVVMILLLMVQAIANDLIRVW